MAQDYMPDEIACAAQRISRRECVWCGDPVVNGNLVCAVAECRRYAGHAADMCVAAEQAGLPIPRDLRGLKVPTGF